MARNRAFGTKVRKGCLFIAGEQRGSIFNLRMGNGSVATLTVEDPPLGLAELSCDGRTRQVMISAIRRKKRLNFFEGNVPGQSGSTVQHIFRAKSPVA